MPNNKKSTIPVTSVDSWEFNGSLSSNKPNSSKKIAVPIFQTISPYYYDDRCWVPQDWLQQAKKQANLKLKTAPVTNVRVGITFSKTANRASVSQFTIDLLHEIMSASGNPSLLITSTLRTAEDQARAMFQNIKSKGYEYNYDLYGANGDAVVKVAENAQKKKLSDTEIISEMVKEINRIGPGKVSKHAGDPKKTNVVDIAPSSLTNRKGFEKEVEKRKIFMLKPPADPAYHLEITQPETVIP